MMKNYNTTAVYVAACAGIAFFGVTMLSLGPILGQLNEMTGGAANALPSTMSIGIIIGTILFGPIVDKFGYKWLLIISSIFALAGIQGLAHLTTLPLMHASIACLGLGGGVLNGLTNALAADIYDDDNVRASRMGILGAIYCVGALLWTLLTYFIADFHIPLNAVSVIMAAFIVYFFCINFPTAKPNEGGNNSAKDILSLLKYPALLLFSVVLFFESGFEGITGNFTVEFFTNMNVMPVKVATLAMTCYTIGMMAGRFPLGAIMSKLKNLGTLYLYLSVALIGVAVFAFSNSQWMGYAAMVLIGFGVGATFPVILNFIGGTFRNLSGTAMSIAIFIALLGQYTFNFSTGKGFGAGHFGMLPIMLASAVVAMMLIIPLALKASKKIK